MTIVGGDEGVEMLALELLAEEDLEVSEVPEDNVDDAAALSVPLIMTYWLENESVLPGSAEFMVK